MSWNIFFQGNDQPSNGRILPNSWNFKKYTNLSTRNGTTGKSQEKRRIKKQAHRKKKKPTRANHNRLVIIYHNDWKSQSLRPDIAKSNTENPEKKLKDWPELQKICRRGSFIATLLLNHSMHNLKRKISRVESGGERDKRYTGEILASFT